MDTQSFNLRLERNRYKEVVTQAELAREIGCSRGSIIDIENGNIEVSDTFARKLYLACKAIAEASE